MFEPLMLVDSSEIREGKLDELKENLAELARFVESNEPQPIAYQMFLDDAGTLMTVVQIHRGQVSEAGEVIGCGGCTLSPGFLAPIVSISRA